MHHKIADVPTVPHDVLSPQRLAMWMDANGLGSGPVTDVRRLGGGTQNIVLSFRRGGRIHVLRRPPGLGRADGSETMLRESAVLTALRGTAVPHPELVAVCADESVLGSAFYLMEPVDGFNPASALPPEFRDDPATMSRLAFAMVEALAALTDVDVADPSLAELGSKAGWIERQVPRWARRLEALDCVATYEALPKERTAFVRNWLEDHRPAHERPGLVHGDFTFANVLVTPDRPTLAAVVDWELASVGDPRLDLAHFLTSLTLKRVPGLWDLEGVQGIPAAAELIGAYADRTGIDVGTMDWFQVLAGFRLLTLLEETVGRAARGDASPRLAETFRRITERLLDHIETLTRQTD